MGCVQHSARRDGQTQTTIAASASRLVVPAAGTGDPLSNPTRVAPRHIFDVGFGIDNALHAGRQKRRVGGAF